MNTEAVIHYLAEWLEEKVVAAGASGVVVGLSGGIDSAVSACIAKRAFPDDTLAIMMPCKSDVNDLQHAQLLAEANKICYSIVDLGNAYDSLLDIYEKAMESEKQILLRANIKPRLRMTTLYFFAQAKNYLVLGTSNKSEIVIGYATKYGDNAVDIQIIGDLLKKEVYALADYLEIPEVIINKPPSAGLWKDQTDEQEMGLTYKELDEYLDSNSGSEETITRIKEMICRSEHKRSLPLIARIPQSVRQR
ncbi:MAG: NAD(+) synthase [Syntrophomonadaceae bacterium]|jgi:NAD+ synthase